MDAGTIVATLMIEDGFMRRKMAREARVATEVSVRAAQDTELSRMREASDVRLAAAQVDAFVQIASGAVTLGSMATEGSLGKTHGVMTNGGATVVKATGDLFSAGLRHDADASDRAAKSAGYSASALKRLAEACGEDEQAAGASIRKAVDLLKEYEATRAQSQAAAFHRA